MFRKKFGILMMLICSIAIAQRICLSPDALYVDNNSQRSLHLFIYVPPNTASYIIGIFDQQDDEGTVGQPSSFVLYAPDGSVVQRLENPLQKEWSDYEVQVGGRWGVWQLSVTSPQPPSDQKQNVRNNFLVRTIGDVDLYIKPEPRARITFSSPHFGSPPTHSFTIQVPRLDRFRLNFIRPQEENTVRVLVSPPKGIKFSERWGGSNRGDREFMEIKGENLKGLWKLTVTDVKGDYSLGIEQELRLFFTDNPLMDTRDVLLRTVDEDGKTPLPARADITSPQTRLESYVIYTNLNGSSFIALIPDALYTITVSRGFEYEPYTLLTSGERSILTVPLRRILSRPKGWYCGDSHMHTIYSDGNDTPLQMVEAGIGEGLDWVVLTDHGVYLLIKNVLQAHKEGMALSRPGKFVVIPGEEFTVPSYHANVINGTVTEPATVSLNQLVRTVRKMNTPQHPITVKLNHPYWGGTIKAPDIARETSLLPLIELWNDDPPNEPRSAYLLWELLNRGLKIFGDTATDTHNRKTSKVGARRTYVYLGDLPLTAENVTKALSDGHSFVSRGALIFFSIEGKIPGEEVIMKEGKSLKINITVESISPIDRVELVNNGKVLHTISVGGAKRFSAELSLPFDKGWVIAQAVEKDTVFPLAMTNPIFLKERER